MPFEGQRKRESMRIREKQRNDEGWVSLVSGRVVLLMRTAAGSVQSPLTASALYFVPHCHLWVFVEFLLYEITVPCTMNSCYRISSLRYLKTSDFFYFYWWFQARTAIVCGILIWDMLETQSHNVLKSQFTSFQIVLARSVPLQKNCYAYS